MELSAPRTESAHGRISGFQGHDCTFGEDHGGEGGHVMFFSFGGDHGGEGRDGMFFLWRGARRTLFLVRWRLVLARWRLLLASGHYLGMGSRDIPPVSCQYSGRPCDVLPASTLWQSPASYAGPRSAGAAQGFVSDTRDETDESIIRTTPVRG